MVQEWEPNSDRERARLALIADIKDQVGLHSESMAPAKDAPAYEWTEYIQTVAQRREILTLLKIPSGAENETQYNRDYLRFYLDKALNYSDNVRNDWHALFDIHAQAATSFLMLGDVDAAWEWTAPILSAPIPEIVMTEEYEENEHNQEVLALHNHRLNSLNQILMVAVYQHLMGVPDVDQFAKELQGYEPDLVRESHALDMAELFHRLGRMDLLDALLKVTLTKGKTNPDWKEVSVQIVESKILMDADYAWQNTMEFLSGDQVTMFQQMQRLFVAKLSGNRSQDKEAEAVWKKEIVLLHEAVWYAARNALDFQLPALRRAARKRNNELECDRIADEITDLLLELIEVVVLSHEFSAEYEIPLAKRDDLQILTVAKELPFINQVPVLVEYLHAIEVEACTPVEKVEQMHHHTSTTLSFIKELHPDEETIDEASDLLLGTFYVLYAQHDFMSAQAARHDIKNPVLKNKVFAQMIIDLAEKYPHVIGSDDFTNVVFDLIRSELTIASAQPKLDKPQDVLSRSLGTAICFTAMLAGEWPAYFRQLDLLPWVDRFDVIRQTLHWIETGVEPLFETSFFDATELMTKDSE
jgi:hypothetical protein